MKRKAEDQFLKELRKKRASEYIVGVPSSGTIYYSVLAYSKEEALELIKKGSGDEIDFEIEDEGEPYIV